MSAQMGAYHDHSQCQKPQQSVAGCCARLEVALQVTRVLVCKVVSMVMTLVMMVVQE